MSQRASQREEIERSLGGYQASAVAVIAAEHGIERSRFSRKNDQIEELARRLASGAGLRELLSKLTPPQIEALAFVARKGGQAALRSVTTLLSRQSGSQEQADKLVHELLLRGLLLFAGGGNSWRLDLSGHDPTLHMRLVWIPRSVAELLPGDGGWAPLVEPASEPAETRAGDPGDLLRDVYLALRSLRARPMRLTQQGEPHQSDLRRVVTEMRPHIDPKNWRDAAGDIMIAVALATSASLLDLGDAGFAPSPAADEFLVATRPAQVARLYAAWRELDWNELERVPTLQVDGYAGGYGDVPDAARLAAARGLIDAVLRELADREWWSVGSLSAAIRRRDPDFLVGGATSVALLIGSWGYWSPYTTQHSEEYRGIRRAGVTDYRKSALSRETDWDEVEGAYLRQTLLDPLRWLGIVDVGLDGRGRVVAARVTPLGRSVLTGASAPPAPARVGGARLVVQPNFEVIVLDATASLDLMARLDGFATARSVDRAAIYHLTREGLVAALQGGARLAEIERLLEEESGGPLPQNVRYSLTEWARQFERVTVRRAATMLEADDAAQLDRWLAEPALGRLLGERLGPTVALVPAANVAAVVERLRRHDGWREENAAGPLPGALRLRGDQALHLKAEAAGRFERHRLAGFADEVDADRAGRLYRVTANSAARARDQGWTAAKVLALLHNRLGVEPPADLTLKLRGWLGDFGAAQQATMRLVRLPDPSLWRVVEPAAAGGVVARVGPAMAVVDEAALALIAEALAAHGVRLEATTPATAAGPLLGARRDEAAPLAGHDLQTLRGKPLREFLQSAATNKRDVTLMHQGANQRSPKRHTVTPRYVDHRMNGYYLVATTEAGTDRAFKLDDIFGVALEEGQ